MIGTSFAEWVFVRLCIYLFRYTPLLYLAGIVLIRLAYGQAAWNAFTTNVLLLLLVAEGLFFSLIYWPYIRRLSKEAVHPEPLSAEKRRQLLDQCLHNVESIETYLRGWFHGAEIEEIRRENVREFILWAFFEVAEATSDDLDDTEEQVDVYLSIIEQRLGYSLGEGRGNVKSLRLTIDDISTTYRSLLWYAVVFIIDQATHVAFLWHGFQYHRRSSKEALATFPPRPQELLSGRHSPASGLGYWHRPHRSAGKRPVIFFHGIGIGLWTYVRFLADLNGDDKDNEGMEVIAIEILPISFRLSSPPQGKDEFLRQMMKILDHHGWDEFTPVSHSYGSVLITHMLDCPKLGHRIPSMVMIDPVTIMLHMPDIAYNFTRRQPKRANEWQLWYFASSDPGVAHCLGRHFFWRENIIWKSELLTRPGTSAEGFRRRKVAVSLAGRDLIVDTYTVRRYLERQEDAQRDEIGHDNGHADNAVDGVEVLSFPKLDHAQVFDSPPDCARVVELVRLYCST